MNTDSDIYKYPPLREGPSVMGDELVSEDGPVHNKDHEAHFYYGEEAGGYTLQRGQPINKLHLGYVRLCVGMLSEDPSWEGLSAAVGRYEEGLEGYVVDHYTEFTVPPLLGNDNEKYEGRPLSETRDDPAWRGHVQLLACRNRPENRFFFMAIDRCNREWDTSYPLVGQLASKAYVPMEEIGRLILQSRATGPLSFAQVEESDDSEEEEVFANWVDYDLDDGYYPGDEDDSEVETIMGYEDDVWTDESDYGVWRGRYGPRPSDN
ncbi:hypothetical protein CC2G_012184 [Coprinopsis cinerea AmutBmut pab1-1]|nr:hypothetical protein CC2G_012184 [Coprinopsis cinerea AmutBmut pab1-1]